MRACLLLASLCAVVSIHLGAAEPDPEPGISLALAQSRAARISNLRYDLRLRIQELAGRPIEGRSTIQFDLTGSEAPLVLDFAVSRDHVKAVEANGRPAAFEWVNGHIVIAENAVQAGANELVIDFVAGDASLNRSPDFLYALFVPARAHLAIPCFDQPDLKARWTLTLDVPEYEERHTSWRMVANGADAPVVGGYVRGTAGGTNGRVFKFLETPPLPTYLFSFVVGEFKVETAERNGRTFRMFHRETDAAKVTRNRDAIFDLHARAIEFMERYTGIPYPFGKFDVVLIPAFQFGGMEHAGKILYNAPGLLLDESATQNQQLGRASVIAHETAHMWFGDLVTMRWFNDVWMKEVFANFMAAKIVNPSFPTVNHDLRFLLAHYPSAYEVDRTAGTNPIRQPLQNLNEAGSLYGAIIYQKAPIVMRHLEALMGETDFRDGLREYLKAHAFGNATWLDLIEVLDQRTPRDLRAWSRVWVEQQGRPTISTDLVVEEGRVTRLAFRQTDPDARGLVWPQQLRVSLGYPDTPRRFTVSLEGAEAVVPEAVGLPEPLYVLPNGAGWGYGLFAVDEGTLGYLTRSLPEMPDPLTRGSAWVTLWDAMLEGRVSAERIVDLALDAAPQEKDEQLTSRALGYLSHAWWRFLSPEQRAARRSRSEAVLRAGLDRASTASQKAAWFNTLRDTAMTGDTVAWLRRVWEKAETVPGLPMAEPDELTLALELAVREVPGWRALLDAQLARTQNPDRKARFAFVMPALSAEVEARDRWFESLKQVENRRKEPWVLEGLNYLHHPLRAGASAKHVPTSLRMLREIQETGDIFFPKRWLDATLGGYSSPDVAEMVRAFLNGMSADYPARLRNITLQSADELFRAAEETR